MSDESRFITIAHKKNYDAIDIKIKDKISKQKKK